MNPGNRIFCGIAAAVLCAFCGQADAGAITAPVIAHTTGIGVAAGGQAMTLPVLDAILARQMKAWQTQDFSAAAGDWLPDGVLISPGGQVKVGELPAVIQDYAAHFGDLKVTVTRTFLSQDGKSALIEWDWEVTRKRDGKHGVTHDAIVVDFEGTKIKTWHEFFDLGDSVDANP